MEVRCDDCGEIMILVDTDSRQEWTEEQYVCEECDKEIIHRTEYNQSGLVTSDKLIEM